jgi:hypothetical protein
LRGAGETGRIEVFEGKPRRPEHVCLADVVAFIKNADAREFKIIRLKEGKIITEDKEGECKIMFCFDRDVQSNKIYLGTPFCYKLDGETKTGNLSLQYAGENGLFVHFWKEYDALLRHAFRKINCKLNMPVSDFLKFNVCTPKLLNGTPALPVNIRYSISNKGIRITESEFLSLRLLKPYNLEDEQGIPPLSTSQYYWARYDNISDIYQYARNRYPLGVSYIIRIVAISFPANVSIAPTEDQYNAGGQYYMEQCVCEIRRYPNPAHPLPDGNSYDDYVLLETTNYTTWLEPRSK